MSTSLATGVAMLLPYLRARLGRDPGFGAGPLATVMLASRLRTLNGYEPTCLAAQTLTLLRSLRDDQVTGTAVSCSTIAARSIQTFSPERPEQVVAT